MAENNAIKLFKSMVPDVGRMVDQLEIEMLKLDQAECPVYHHFSPGIYVREVNMPAGIFAIGHKQKTRHLNIFLKGSVSILNDDGTTTKLDAPMIFTGEPGRKVGYIHEDVVWLNVYPTTETDIKTLEATYLDKSDAWKDLQPKQEPRVDDREDYYRMLEEYGYTEEIVRAQSENESDQIPFPDGSYFVGVFPSAIEGNGLFSMANAKVGDVICPARIGTKRTPAGRFTNHSKTPNAEMQWFGDDIYLVAIQDIKGCCGGLLGDEITVDYRKSLSLQGIKPCQE